jgi:hypothetical protein
MEPEAYEKIKHLLRSSDKELQHLGVVLFVDACQGHNDLDLISEITHNMGELDKLLIYFKVQDEWTMRYGTE